MYDAVWDWQNGSPASITSTNIQSTTGTVESNIEDVVLTVDATSSGKLAYNSSGYAQFNAGTEIKVPVNEGSTVTVVAYPGQYNYTVAGVAAKANTTTYTATKDGYCPIVATGGAYLYSISVTNVTASADHTESVVEFTAASTTVTNDEDTLGLTATTATSADETIATAEVTTDGIVITSVAAGTTTVSAKDADSNEATITVTVGVTGAVTIGTITPYTSSLPESFYIKYNWESESTGGTRVTSGTDCVYGVAYSDEDFSKTFGIDDSYVSAVTSGSFNKDNSTYVQPATDSLMQIPVSEGSVVTISFWDSGAASKFSLAGETVTTTDLTLNLSGKTGNGMSYTATAVGYVELKCLSSYYIRYITVSNVLTADVDSHSTNVAE